MNSMHTFVRSWLESVFTADSGDSSIPNYEVSEANLAALYNLASLSQSRSKDGLLRTQLQTTQTAEYKSETNRICLLYTSPSPRD